jgi:hypothetical protein
MITAKIATYLSRTFSFEQKLSEPEACYGKPREATGFLATLTPEQREKALAYRGSENFGDKSYRRATA